MLTFKQYYQHMTNCSLADELPEYHIFSRKRNGHHNRKEIFQTRSFNNRVALLHFTYLVCTLPETNSTRVCLISESEAVTHKDALDFYGIIQSPLHQAVVKTPPHLHERTFCTMPHYLISTSGIIQHLKSVRYGQEFSHILVDNAFYLADASSTKYKLCLDRVLSHSLLTRLSCEGVYTQYSDIKSYRTDIIRLSR